MRIRVFCSELSNGLEVSKHMLFLLFILTNFQIQCIGTPRKLKCTWHSQVRNSSIVCCFFYFSKVSKLTTTNWSEMQWVFCLSLYWIIDFLTSTYLFPTQTIKYKLIIVRVGTALGNGRIAWYMDKHHVGGSHLYSACCRQRVKCSESFIGCHCNQLLF